MSPDDEKASVFEIIADLEKQLDASFSLKDSSEKDILILKEAVMRAEEKAAIHEAKLREMKGMLLPQEELNADLESLEDERLESVGRMKTLKEEIEAREVQIKNLGNKIAALDRECEARDTRIEEVEVEASGSNRTIQGLHHQVSLLEDEKDASTGKLEELSLKLSSIIVERDRARRDLEQARESLDEIRLMLAETRARARAHYYKAKR